MPDRQITQKKAFDYRDERISYWNSYIRRRSGRYYHDEITRIYRFLVPPGRRVLELGCGQGDLLAALRPCHGVGVYFSRNAVANAEARHPDLHFILGDAQS